MHLLKYFVFLFCFAAISESTKVVVIVQNINSHFIYHAKISRLLADEGHSVSLVLPSHVKVPDIIKESNVSILTYDGREYRHKIMEEYVSALVFEYAMSDTWYQRLRVYLKMVKQGLPAQNDMCADMLNDKRLTRHIDDVSYEVAIIDVLSLTCSKVLFTNKRIHTVPFGLFVMEWTLRVPVLPSFIPSHLSGFDDKMSFWQRMANTLIYMTSNIFFYFMPNPPVPINDMLERTSLYFSLDDISIQYPMPSMPNVINVGDAIPQPGQPLPSDIAEFVQSAQYGVVVVSFGSYLDHIPSKIAHKFCSAFNTIPQKVVWKLKNKTLCDADPDKVLLLDWLPQNDLLSHHNVKLFISHCGINSVLESIYHATPIIGFPLGLDQPYNAKRLQSRGLGYQMNFNDFTADELASKIFEVVNEKRVLQNVEKASFLLRNKPDSPQKRLSYWVEHLAKYGGGHLKSPASQLNVFQFYCIDLILTLIGIFLFTASVAFHSFKAAFIYVKCRYAANKLKYD